MTGGDGFLGSAVVRQLNTLDAQVMPVTRRIGGSHGATFCDLGDPTAVCRLLNDCEPDCIVCVAAVADFGRDVLPSLYPVNTLCPAIMADYCRRHDAHLIFTSMAVHGRQVERFGPETPVRPETDYGISKWLAEQAITASGCRAAIIRFGGIFGPTGPEHLGINRAIRQAQAGVVPAAVGTGAARRNYIYIEDAAAGVRTCVANGLTGLFFSGGESLSFREMLQSICDVWLPGRGPVMRAGDDGPDQLVHVSPELGPTRTFREALEHAR